MHLVRRNLLAGGLLAASASGAKAAGSRTGRDAGQQTGIGGVQDAGSVNFTPAGTGAVPMPVQDKLRLLPISTIEWGITADSNGTTGDGTDWTTELQALVDYARANGRNIWVPAKPGYFIRFTGSIDFTGAQTTLEVIGESKFDSAFFADFTSASNVAAFSNNASSGARSYVAWRNFRLQGRSDTDATNRVRGIYSNFGGEFTEFESIFVIHFYDNVVVANDYNLRLSRCLLWYAKNDNLQIGYDIGGAPGACNNVNIDSAHLTYAGRYGGYIYACRALNVSGGGAEGNAQGNLFLDAVYGGSITGYYMEYAPSEAGNPTFQLRFRNCFGCTVNGLSVSAFDDAGNPIVYVEDSTVISLRGLAFEQSGADLSAVGVLVSNSAGVEVQGFFNGMTTGARLTSGSRVTIANSNILAATPVSTASPACILVWRDAIDAQVTASVASIDATTATDIVRVTLARNVIDNAKVFQADGAYGDLGAAATRIIINTELLSESYRISNIRLQVVDAFAGGGGDRDLVIRDSTTVYATIPASSLQTLDARGVWGSTVVPHPAGALVTATQAGADLYMQYSGGTTDYATGGAVAVYVDATRIA